MLPLVVLSTSWAGATWVRKRKADCQAFRRLQSTASKCASASLRVVKYKVNGHQFSVKKINVRRRSGEGP